ncbi:MAG: hypothetical protein ABW049_13180, partial [Spongiibacteraceae bacterium]
MIAPNTPREYVPVGSGAAPAAHGHGNHHAIPTPSFVPIELRDESTAMLDIKLLRQGPEAIAAQLLKKKY